MDTDFHVGAHVVCTDGPVGHLRQLVLDPASETVTHLVVDTQPHFGYPVLVPRQQVESADREEVRLTCTRDDLQKMDQFEEVHFINAGMPVGGMATAASEYLYPVPVYGGGALGGNPMTPLAGSGPQQVVEEVVPPGEVVVNRDATVEASDGEVGHVEDVIVDPDTGRLTHIVVRSGHLWTRHTFPIPVEDIAQVSDGNVRLRLSSAEVEARATGSLR